MKHLTLFSTFEAVQTEKVIVTDPYYAGEEYDYDEEEDEDPSSILTNETYEDYDDDAEDETGCGNRAPNLKYLGASL